MKIFPAFFVAAEPEEDFTLKKMAEELEAFISGWDVTENIHNWSCLSTLSTHIIVPEESLPYGEATGIFTKEKQCRNEDNANLMAEEEKT